MFTKEHDIHINQEANFRPRIRSMTSVNRPCRSAANARFLASFVSKIEREICMPQRRHQVATAIKQEMGYA